MEYFITSAGIPVHINESKKDGPAILLLHGYLETLYIWNEFLDLFPSEYRTISIDLPGHGLSGVPSDGFTPEFALTFFSVLLEKLSVTNCHIITHSFSYHLASIFARFFPDKVISIVNIGSSTTTASLEYDFINSAKQSLSEGSFMKFVSLYIPKMYHNSTLRACDEKIEETIEICETHDPEALLNFFSGIKSFFSDIDKSIFSSVPCLHITGSHNCFMSDIPEEFSVIKESGLNSFIEKPADVFGRLSDFLIRR